MGYEKDETLNEPYAGEYLQFLEFKNYPEEFHDFLQLFQKLGHIIFVNCPSNPERLEALKKLIEVKDHALRAQQMKYGGIRGFTETKQVSQSTN